MMSLTYPSSVGELRFRPPSGGRFRFHRMFLTFVSNFRITIARGGDCVAAASKRRLAVIWEGKDALVLENGEEVARIVSPYGGVTFFVDSPVRISRRDIYEMEIVKERRKKLEGAV